MFCKMQIVKPNLQRQIFWDVDFDKIDYQTNFQFVITRAFERGDVDDIRAVRTFYGDEKVINVLKSAKYLFYHTFSLVKNMFQLKETDFRCYTLNRSKGVPWGY